MDSFFADNIKAEKAKAMLRYRRLRKMASLFRCLEVCVALLLLSWFSSTHLPLAFRISGHYFRELSVVLVSPRFVFLVGNAIILTLFAKSHGLGAGVLSPNTSSAADSLYDEFVKNNADNHTRPPLPSDTTTLSSPATPEPEPEELAYQDKDTMHDEEVEEEGAAKMLSKHELRSNSKVIFRRSQSENMNFKLRSEVTEKPRRELRRCETENSHNIERNAEKVEEEMASCSYSHADENMSNEEFQRTIEAFIARHRRFRREEESMDILLQNEA